MRWDDTANGGFSDGDPWLPLDPEGSTSVTAQRSDDRSTLMLFRALLKLRREHACLREGAYHPLRSQNDILAFERRHEGQDSLILLNIVAEPRKWPSNVSGRVLLSTHLDRAAEALTKASVLLRGNEGVIVARGPSG
jgi:alpha-glucosidase